MNNKAAKKLRRLAIAIAAANGKIEDSERIYKNLKTVHKENKKAPKYIGANSLSVCCRINLCYSRSRIK